MGAPIGDRGRRSRREEAAPRETDGPRRSFHRGQLGRLGRVLDLAREVTGDFYRLTAEAAGRLPYEVRTLRQLERSEIRPAGVLADVVRYEYRDTHYQRKRDLYRINLQDHNILAALTEGPRIDFSPFLLYILTHELVHVIRFCRHEVPFYLDPRPRQEEERRVHELTRRILERVPMRGLGRVLEGYRGMLEEFRAR
ncbi:MAG: nucleoid-associated protein [Myxococcales bacterium]|nr:nucleoid-associated protein [Myxococcales bacterium]